MVPPPPPPLSGSARPAAPAPPAHPTSAAPGLENRAPEESSEAARYSVESGLLARLAGGGSSFFSQLPQPGGSLDPPPSVRSVAGTQGLCQCSCSWWWQWLETFSPPLPKAAPGPPGPKRGWIASEPSRPDRRHGQEPTGGQAGSGRLEESVIRRNKLEQTWLPQMLLREIPLRYSTPPTTSLPLPSSLLVSREVKRRTALASSDLFHLHFKTGKPVSNLLLSRCPPDIAGSSSVFSLWGGLTKAFVSQISFKAPRKTGPALAALRCILQPIR
eukprot:XP_017449415.1 PREDICTED: uncharacterized protein LOC108351105 [Rattus norvegicus]